MDANQRGSLDKVDSVYVPNLFLARLCGNQVFVCPISFQLLVAEQFMAESQLLEPENKSNYYFGLLGLYAMVAGLLMLTWRRWPDVVIDFGRELYVPWRLSEGYVLYSDIAYFNGPLSPYFNGLMFHWFGASLTTLIVTNVVLLLILVTLIYLLLTRAFDVGTAFLTTTCFLPLFAFSHALLLGNYNYICPYSHEMTHGILMAFGILALLSSKNHHAWWRCLLVGLLWGGVFLGKAELFLAVSGMIVFAFFINMRRGDSTAAQLAKHALLYLVGAILPAVLFVVLLSRQMPQTDAVHGVLGTWMHVFDSNVTDEVFYQRLAGFDPWYPNLMVVLKSAIAIALALVAAKYIEDWREAGREARGSSRGLFIAVAALAGLVFLPKSMFSLLLHGRALPVVAISLFTLYLIRWWRSEVEDSRSHGLVWTMIVLGGLMLAKFPLRTTLFHYGFVLAMPLTVVAIGWCLSRAPKLLCPNTTGRTCRMVLIVFLFADVVFCVNLSAKYYLAKDVPLGQNHDRLWSDHARGGDVIAEAVEFLLENTSDEESVLVLPEGVMINYMSRRHSSTKYVNLCPPEVTMYGESEICRAIAEQPADYIVLVNVRFLEYGWESFGGAGFGQSIMNLINEKYQVIEECGEPLSSPHLPGATIFKRL